MVEWIQTHETILWWLAAASVVTFLGTLVLVPVVIVRIPSDYFAPGKRRGTRWTERHPVVRATWLIAKNVLGCFFIVVGVAMLVLPGQGLLTILIGMVLIDFPGKYRLERWIVGRGPVLRSVNWLRRRAGKGPLVLGCKSRFADRS